MGRGGGGGGTEKLIQNREILLHNLGQRHAQVCVWGGGGGEGDREANPK